MLSVISRSVDYESSDTNLLGKEVKFLVRGGVSIGAEAFTVKNTCVKGKHDGV